MHAQAAGHPQHHAAQQRKMENPMPPNCSIANTVVGLVVTAPWRGLRRNTKFRMRDALGFCLPSCGASVNRTWLRSAKMHAKNKTNILLTFKWLYDVMGFRGHVIGSMEEWIWRKIPQTRRKRLRT